MIEVIVVLIILAVLGAVVASRISSTSTHELAAQVEVIKTHLRYAQTRAMGSDTIWGIDSDGSSYWLFKNGNTNDKVNLPGEDSDIVDLSAKGMSMEVFTLSFDSWGKPFTDASGSTELSADDPEETITVSSGSDTKSITITPNTGFIP